MTASCLKPIVLRALRHNPPELTELNLREKGDEILSAEIIMDLEHRFGVELAACDPGGGAGRKDAMERARIVMTGRAATSA